MDAILAELSASVDEDQAEYLRATFTDLLEDDGDPKDLAANLCELLWPIADEAGYQGSEADVLSACLRAVSSAAPAMGLEEIWSQVEALDADAFAWLQEELGQAIVQRGLGSSRYFPPEPEPEPSEADMMSAQLMRDAAVQARKAKVAREAKLAEKEAAGPTPIGSLQALFGVTLEEDIVDYLEGAATGLRDDVADGANEADEAAEELLGIVGPMLEEAGADPDSLEALEPELRKACAAMLSSGEDGDEDEDAAAEDESADDAADPVKPLEACQVLLSVTLEPDIVEYLEEAASGLRTDIQVGATEADEAAEELLGIVGPMLGEAGADEDALEKRESDLRRYCAEMIAPPAAAKQAIPAKKVLTKHVLSTAPKSCARWCHYVKYACVCSISMFRHPPPGRRCEKCTGNWKTGA